jgi:hypothetical protein
MPHARHALAVRASARDTWPAQRDDGASSASGGIRLRPPPRQKPLGQGISQTERCLSLRNACMIAGIRDDESAERSTGIRVRTAHGVQSSRDPAPSYVVVKEKRTQTLGSPYRGDITSSHLLGLGDVKLARQEIWRPAVAMATVRRDWSSPCGLSSNNSCLAHQPARFVAAHGKARRWQLLGHVASPLAIACRSGNRLHLRQYLESRCPF